MIPNPVCITTAGRSTVGRAASTCELDPDGHGTLIINANRILHLNPTAALMTYLILEGTSDDDGLILVRHKYHVKAAQVRSDLQMLRSQLEELVRPDGACPIHDLGLETVMPFSARPTAPYRIDLALTYRCNNDCAHCYNVEGRNLQEISTVEWMHVLDKAWELGIPHCIFTGGEPTLREDLPDLVAHAEHNGQITGLNTNARRLADPGYVEKLVSAGLDHVQITVKSCELDVHDRMVRTRGAFQQTIKGLEECPGKSALCDDQHHHVAHERTHHPRHTGFPGRDRSSYHWIERPHLFGTRFLGWNRPC